MPLLGKTKDMTKQDQPLAWVANQLKPKLCPSHSKILHQAWFEPGRVWDGWLFHPVFGPSLLRLHHTLTESVESAPKPLLTARRLAVRLWSPT